MISEAEDIESESLRIIEGGISSPYPERRVIARVIHATADFEFADIMVFKNGPIEKGIKAIRSGRDVIADVNMVRAGINSKALAVYGGRVKCFIEHEEVSAMARSSGITRARSSVRIFREEYRDSVAVIGNAPTALLELCQLLKEGIRPAIIVATPVGFVGAKEAKERVLRYRVPSIVTRGNKGGSPVAVAIVNALIGLADRYD